MTQGRARASNASAKGNLEDTSSALPTAQGHAEDKSEALGVPRLLNPNGAQNSRPLEGLGLLEQHQQHAQDGCLDCAWCHQPGTLAQLATEQTDVPRTASGRNGRLVG